MGHIELCFFLWQSCYFFSDIYLEALSDIVLNAQSISIWNWNWTQKKTLKQSQRKKEILIYGSLHIILLLVVHSFVWSLFSFLFCFSSGYDDEHRCKCLMLQTCHPLESIVNVFHLPCASFWLVFQRFSACTFAWHWPIATRYSLSIW